MLLSRVANEFLLVQVDTAVLTQQTILTSVPTIL
jgi:hypothetical protein